MYIEEIDHVRVQLPQRRLQVLPRPRRIVLAGLGADKQLLPHPGTVVHETRSTRFALNTSIAR